MLIMKFLLLIDPAF